MIVSSLFDCLNEYHEVELKKSFQFRNIRARLTFWFFLMALIPMIVSNFAFYKQHVYQLSNWTIVIGFLTLAGVVITAFFVSKSISEPIRMLQAGSHIIGSGNLEYKVGTSDSDEIGELSRIIDQMTENLRAVTITRNELDREINERKLAETALRESEERYRLQFNETRDAIFISDAETSIIIDCNRAATLLVGKNKSEIVGRKQNIFYPAKEVLRDAYIRTVEKWADDKEGEMYFAKIMSETSELKDVSIKANLFELKGKMYLQEIFRDITEQRELEKTLVDIEEYERYRLGYELHDGLGQLLAGISFKCRFLEDSLKEKAVPEAKDAARITSLIDEAKEQVRNLTKGRTPMEMDSDGLLAALKNFSSNIEKIFKIPCLFKRGENVTVNNKTAALHLFRIAQEAVTNVVKHGKPGRIEIGIDRKDDIVELTIRDDKNDLSVSRDLVGMGMKIMKYRAGIIGASLDVLEDNNTGTVLKCIFHDRLI